MKLSRCPRFGLTFLEYFLFSNSEIRLIRSTYHFRRNSSRIKEYRRKQRPDRHFCPQCRQFAGGQKRHYFRKENDRLTLSLTARSERPVFFVASSHAGQQLPLRPLDNAVAETFFSSFKREEAYRKDYTSEQHFRRSVEEYIRFYNEVRPHQTLNYKTPQAFENAYRGVLSENGV